MSAIFRVVDLFAGCGGLTEGFRKTKRFRPVGAVEIDLAAAATYAQNFGEAHIHLGGIAEWAGGDLPDADVVVGGPPCQGFSNLGKRRDDDPRNELWREYVRVLNKIEPMAFLVENVDRFLESSQFRSLRNQTRSDGRLSDYTLRYGVLTATEFGSSQRRRRAIVIGTHRDFEPIDVPTAIVPRQMWRTVRQALHGVSEKVAEGEVDLPAASVEHFGMPIPGAFKSADLHVTRRYEPMSRDRFRHIPPGGNRFDLPDHLKAPCWLKHNSGAGDVMGRLHWDRPSVTIRTEFFKPEKGRYLHPTEHRAITHYEAALIQGFGDDFQWCGTKLQIARQIGNAVPVELARTLGQHLAKELDKRL